MKAKMPKIPCFQGISPSLHQRAFRGRLRPPPIISNIYISAWEHFSTSLGVMLGVSSIVTPHVADFLKVFKVAKETAQ